MNGTEYRCIVSQTDLSTEKSSVVYSNMVKLTVGKADSTTELGTSRTGGNATHETTVETKKTVTAEYNRGMQPTRSIKMRTLKAIKSQAMFSAAVTVLAIIIIRG